MASVRAGRSEFLVCVGGATLEVRGVGTGFFVVGVILVDLRSAVVRIFSLFRATKSILLRLFVGSGVSCVGLRLCAVVFAGALVVAGAVLVAVLARTAALRLGRDSFSWLFLTADRFTVTVLFVILSLAAAAAARVRGMSTGNTVMMPQASFPRLPPFPAFLLGIDSCPERDSFDRKKYFEAHITRFNQVSVKKKSWHPNHDITDSTFLPKLIPGTLYAPLYLFTSYMKRKRVVFPDSIDGKYYEILPPQENFFFLAEI